MAAGKTFTETDSWAVAIAFMVFAILSVLIENSLHWLKHHLHAKPTLLKVVHKAEEELFLLGCVSFTLLVFENMLVENTCVKSSRFDADNWAMCPYTSSYHSSYNSSSYSSTYRRKLTASTDDSVCGDDSEPFLSAAVLHQVHLFIFFLALAHVCYTTATLALGRWRLRNMMAKRLLHSEKTMAKVGQLTTSDAHSLAGKMVTRRTLLHLEKDESNELGGMNSGIDEKKKDFKNSPSNGGDDFNDATDDIDVTPKLGHEECVTQFAADALRGDGAALAEKQHHFTFGLSRSTKHRHRMLNIDKLKTWIHVPSKTFIAEVLGVRLPEATLIRFELLFLRQHNVRSLSFDFPQYVVECVDCDSGDQLGMSPGRWLIATAIIVMMGPFEKINLVISIASLVTLLGLAAWLKTRVDYIMRVEKFGDELSDGRLFLLSHPRLAKDLFIFILYQQSFHVASWIFGAWQIGVGTGYGCYYGETWSVVVSGVSVMLGLLVGGYVILPLEALVSQMSGAFRAELLDEKVQSVMTTLAAKLERRRRGIKKFATQEQAVVHIQKTFRARKKRNLDKAARVAMLHAASSGSRASGKSSNYSSGKFGGSNYSSGGKWSGGTEKKQKWSGGSVASVDSIDEVRVEIPGEDEVKP